MLGQRLRSCLGFCGRVVWMTWRSLWSTDQGQNGKSAALLFSEAHMLWMSILTFGMLLLFLSEDGGKHFHDELTQMHLFTAV